MKRQPKVVTYHTRDYDGNITGTRRITYCEYMKDEAVFPDCYLTNWRCQYSDGDRYKGVVSHKDCKLRKIQLRLEELENKEKIVSNKYVQYEHHGKLVWVRADLKGKHRDLCLCFDCDKFNVENREENCQIANDTFANCVKNDLTTPVTECAEFVEKGTKNG